MKKITLVIKPNRKETQEERKERVKNDKANRSYVIKSKKQYNRQQYKSFDY